MMLQRNRSRRGRRAFTLIELLVVIAIIAILAAIAVPNFLEAQVRAKVARVKSDFRTVATGLESYVIDNNHFPPMRPEGLMIEPLWFEKYLYQLTTPVAYLSSVSLEDPFVGQVNIASMQFVRPFYMYINYEPLMPGDWASVCESDPNWGLVPHRAFGLSSPGPDKTESYLYFCECGPEDGPPDRPWLYIQSVYDSTNGTISSGDIMRFGGDMRYSHDMMND